jgi:hypothetical protein
VDLVAGGVDLLVAPVLGEGGRVHVVRPLKAATAQGDQRRVRVGGR